MIPVGPPDSSRNVLTWVRDEGGNEHWQIDMYLADGWVEAVPWRQEVLEWRELPSREVITGGTRWTE